MTILRYTASADNTITNAFDSSLLNRGTSSNMGAADILEVFSIYGNATTSSVELSRILLQFPIDKIIEDRNSGLLAGSGEVRFMLKLYNSPHFEPVPKNFDLQVTAVSSSWEEGEGLDMEDYSDVTNGAQGSTWIERNGNPVSEITKFSFDSSQVSDYLATDGTIRYLKLYNKKSLYRIYFSGSVDSLSDSTGTYIKIDTEGLSDNATDIAEQFKLSLHNNKGFRATRDGTSVFVTSSAGKSTSMATGSSLQNPSISIVTSGSDGTPWLKAGGDYHNSPVYTQSFKTGLEDLCVDVSTLVEEWITGESGDNDSGKTNYGFGIRLTNEYEGYFSGSTHAELSGSINIHNITGSTESYYTKKFFGRGTEFFYKQPILEAQFDDSIKDNRNNFYLSSSLLTRAEIMNNLYFYNYFRGQLRDIAGKTTAVPVLRLYYSSGSKPEGERRMFLNSSESPVSFLSASRVSRGVYKATLAASSSIVNTTYPYLHDVWSYLGEEFLTGSAITPIKYKPSFYEEKINYFLSMPNLKNQYSVKDNVKLRLYARKKNWSPNIYSVAKNKPENLTLVSSSYRLIRIIDQLEVVSHGYGSPKYSSLSHDVSGNYFNFDMSMLEPGYQYGFKFSIYDDYTNSYEEQPYVFKFRVV